MATATPTPRYQICVSSSNSNYLLTSTSTSPTLVPSTAIPTTSAPSSNYPSLSPSTVFTITTIAGTGSTTYSGDNGQATAAGLNQPFGVCVDAAGERLYTNSAN